MESIFPFLPYSKERDSSTEHTEQVMSHPWAKWLISLGVAAKNFSKLKETEPKRQFLVQLGVRTEASGTPEADLLRM